MTQITEKHPATKALPKSMRAAALDRFGGPEQIRMQDVPVPEVGPSEILIRVRAAGVGVWDVYERDGSMEDAMPGKTKFPHVMGSDAAGEVVATGDEVERFTPGDRVYAFGYLSPKATFYAEYAVVDQDSASKIPGDLTWEQAGVMPADAMTALYGLDDVLDVGEGDKLMIFGASGGIGHMAIQLAKRMGADVLAVASGDDGVALAKRVGADTVVEGHAGDVSAAVRDFAPDGLDAILATANDDVLTSVIPQVRDGGRVAYPNGVQPEIEARDRIEVRSYDGSPSPERIERLNELIRQAPFHVHVDEVFPLEKAADAHRRLDEHFLGKLALKP